MNCTEVFLPKTKRTAEDDKWLKALGSHIRILIETNGFQSPYDFWVSTIGDQISRTTLNYILNGAVDVKATTLRKIAKALKVPIKDVMSF